VAGKVEMQVYEETIHSNGWVSMSSEGSNKAWVPVGYRAAFRVVWKTIPSAELRLSGGIYDPMLGSGRSEVEGSGTERVTHTYYFVSNSTAAGESTVLRMSARDRYGNHSEVSFALQITGAPTEAPTDTPTITPVLTTSSRTPVPTGTPTVSPTPTATLTVIPTLSPTPTLTPSPTAELSGGAQLLLSQNYGGSTASNRRDPATLRIVPGSAFPGLPSSLAESIRSPRWRSANTTVADIDSDGVKDIVVGFGPGGLGSSDPSIITVWKTEPSSVMTTKGVFSPESPNLLLRNPHGALNVCTGRFTDTFTPQIVTAQGLGGGNQIRILEFREGRLEIIGTFQGLTHEAVWGNSSGGTAVAAGDLDGDGVDELVVGQMNGRSAMTLFQVIDLRKVDGALSVLKRTAPVLGMPSAEFIGKGGVNLAVGDVDGDGDQDIIVASAGLPNGADNPQLRNLLCVYEVATDNRNRITTISRLTPLIQVFGAAANPSGGIDVATGNLDDDPADEILVGTQAIIALDGDSVSVSHPAPTNSIRGYNLEFGENRAFLGLSPVTPRVQVFDRDYAPSSGTVNVEVY